jgi:undecaprenyl-diphosphatase
MRSAAILVTHSGDGLYLLVGLGLTIALDAPPWRVFALRLLIADLATFVVVQIMKFTFKRGRPAGEWGANYRKIDPHSFPSGHAARGGAIGGMAIVAGPLWLGMIFLVWGSAVALSRVVMGVHYLSDAMAGFTLGVLLALGLALLIGL